MEELTSVSGAVCARSVEGAASVSTGGSAVGAKSAEEAVSGQGVRRKQYL